MCAGWIDPDFRGEVSVELKNLSQNEFMVNPGMRIAQLFVLPLASVNIVPVSELPPSKRDQGGFGSTGL
jgi:dUTP pyrophosphatase